jgi:hypothetical protein
MRFAYADPPYPGQAKRHYGDHPDYAGEVDHEALIARLMHEYPDGWALSSSGTAMREILPLCPARARVAIWHVTNSEPPGNRKQPWWWSFEPVYVYGGRPTPIPIRNVLACGAPTGFLGNTITGQKPEPFLAWVWNLLGAQPGDVVDDLFPGSGVCGAFFERQSRQLVAC